MVKMDQVTITVVPLIPASRLWKPRIFMITIPTGVSHNGQTNDLTYWSLLHAPTWSGFRIKVDLILTRRLHFTHSAQEVKFKKLDSFSSFLKMLLFIKRPSFLKFTAYAGLVKLTNRGFLSAYFCIQDTIILPYFLPFAIPLWRCSSI